MGVTEKTAILVISFGTSYEETRKKTIEQIESDLHHAFPEYPLYCAWTSPRIRAKLRKRDGIHIMDIDAVSYTHLLQYPWNHPNLPGTWQIGYCRSDADKSDCLLPVSYTHLIHSLPKPQQKKSPRGLSTDGVSSSSQYIRMTRSLNTKQSALWNPGRRWTACSAAS